MTTGRINQVARDEANRRSQRSSLRKDQNATNIHTPRPAFDTQPALQHRPSLDRTAAPTERTRRRCSSDTNHHYAEALQPSVSAQIHRRTNGNHAASRRAVPNRTPNCKLTAPSPYGLGAGAAHRATTQKRGTNAQTWKRVGTKTQLLTTD